MISARVVNCATEGITHLNLLIMTLIVNVEVRLKMRIQFADVISNRNFQSPRYLNKILSYLFIFESPAFFSGCIYLR